MIAVGKTNGTQTKGPNMTKTRARAKLARLVGIADGMELPPDCAFYAADLLIERAEQRQPRRFNGANYDEPAEFEYDEDGDAREVIEL